MEFGEGSALRTTLSFKNQFSFLVWESPSNSGLPIVIQTVLLHRFPEFIHEKLYFYPGDCHTSDVGHWFAMTGNSQIQICPIAS